MGYLDCLRGEDVRDKFDKFFLLSMETEIRGKKLFL